MENVTGFCDLCVMADTPTNQEKLLETCTKLMSLGYKAIAINYVFEETAVDAKKKKKKGEPKDPQSDIVPPPINLDFLKEFRSKLKIYHRLTIKFSDANLFVKFNQSANIKKYDILAALPLTQTAFQLACGSSFDIDLISFDCENKNVIKITRKLYNQAVNRAIHFEVMYTPAILDSTFRKNIIHMLHLYHAVGRSRNIIISSWGSQALHVRGPHDIINLGLLFGLNEEQSKSAITTKCRDVIIRAGSRKIGKSLMIAEDLNKTEAELPIENEEDMDIDENQPAFKKLKQ